MKMFQSMTIWSLICAIRVQAVLVGAVHVVYHYIGDTSDDSCCEELCNGVIRTVVSGDGECSEQLHSILIDSGADSSIFPASLIGLGKPAEGVIGKLCDAQGVENTS